MHPPISESLSGSPVWLPARGEMADRIRLFDWSKTPVGSPSQWPQSLKTAVQILLGSRYPMFLWWGEALTNFYNDAYAPMLGTRHPAALGQSAREVWADVWPICGPQAEAVLNRGESSWNEELLLVMERNRFVEEAYFTFSYSPVMDEEGRPRGVFCAVTEDTGRVLGRRRLKTLRELGEGVLIEIKTDVQACRGAAKALAANLNDVPFAMIYLLDGDSRRCRLCATINYAPGQKASPEEVTLGEKSDIWNFQAVLGAKRSELVREVRSRFGPLPAGPWPEDSPDCALVLPLAKAGVQDIPGGFLVAGLSPRLQFTEEYRGFLELAAGHIATAIANARAYQEERKQAQALAELNRAKTTFFNNISHEFRTPLTLMLGPVEELLNRKTGSGPEEREQLETVHRNSLRLLKLVNSLLDFSRLEAGRLHAQFEPVDLAALTRELASAFQSAMQKAGLRYQIECPPLSEQVFVDRDMWEKIVFNLLSNAFKFTLKGEVVLRLGIEGEAVVLRVCDTGTGIPKEEMTHLFQRFHRVQNTLARTHEGAGIGLALVYELVHLHGGTVAAQSQVGTGTIFTVRLPLGNSHLPPERIGTRRPQTSTSVRGGVFVEEALHWLGSETRTTGAEAELPGSAPGPARARVLVVEDNSDMRNYICRLLRNKYEVDGEPDGAAALARAKAGAPDLILSDLMMPRMDGVALLQAIRADPQLKAVPVILLSARAGEEARAQGIEQGADDYLVKPFSARELLARVETNLNLARLRREAVMKEKNLFILLQAVNQARALPEIYRAALEAISQCTGATRASIRFRDADGIMRFQAWSGFSEEYRQGVAAHSPWNSDQIDPPPVCLAQPADFPADLRPLLQREGIGALAYIPITWERTLLGKFTICYDQPHVFAEEELHLLQTIASQLGFAVLRQETAEELERLVQDRTARLQDMIGELRHISYAITHDMRAPLRSMNAFADVILEEISKSGQPCAAIQEACQRIMTSAARLDRLIQDSLNYTKLALQAVPLQPVNLATLISDLIQSYPNLQPHKTRIRIADSLPVVLGEESLLTQCFSNLLGNAVKFVEPGKLPEVVIRCTVSGKRARIVIEDNGIGIPAHAQKRLFGMFERLAPKYEGTGIGLAIVRKVVERMGGHVGVRSAPGSGSSFWVELQLEPEPAAAAEQVSFSTPHQLVPGHAALSLKP